MSMFLKLVAMACVVALAAIGFGYWMVLREMARAHQDDSARFLSAECSRLLGYVQDNEMPDGRSQDEIAFCVREGHFSVDDLNRVGTGDLVEHLRDVGLITDRWPNGRTRPPRHALAS